MGMDEKTWKALPPAKRAELLKLQAQQEHEEALARIAADLETQKARLAAEKAREEALKTLYSKLHYGQIVQVGFLRGEGYFYRYRPIVPDSILLPIGTSQKITLRSRNNETLTLWAAYLPGKLVFCSEEMKTPDAFDASACTVKIDRYWRDGEETTLTVPRTWDKKHPLLRNVRIVIKYPPLSDGHRCP